MKSSIWKSMHNLLTTGKDLKSWRNSLGLSQKTLCLRLDIVPSTLWKWEKDDYILPEILRMALRHIEKPTTMKE